MAKHRFLIGLPGDDGTMVGAQCAKSSKAVIFVDGKVPKEILEEQCKHEDFGQAAARIVRETTEL